VAHASILTSSPYKAALEMQKSKTKEVKGKKQQSIKRSNLESLDGQASKKSRKMQNKMQIGLLQKKSTRPSSVSVGNKRKTKPTESKSRKKSKKQ